MSLVGSTNRTDRAGLAMSVVWVGPEVLFRGQQDRFWPSADIGCVDGLGSV